MVKAILLPSTVSDDTEPEELPTVVTPEVIARASSRVEPPFETDAAIQNRRLHELQGRASTQQAQIDRQEQIILSLRDQLQRAGSNRAASPANGRCACMRRCFSCARR